MWSVLESSDVQKLDKYTTSKGIHDNMLLQAIILSNAIIQANHYQGKSIHVE